MMKWGRKGSRASPTHLINYVFPISWLKKLKGKSGTWKAGTEQAKHKGKGNEMTRCSSMPTKFMEGRFYTETDDLYWRLSFGEDSVEEKKDRDVGSIWYNSDGECNVRKSSCKRSRPRSQEGNRLAFNDTIMKKHYKAGTMKEKYHKKGMKAREQRLIASGGYARNDQEQRSSNRLVMKENKSKKNIRYLKKQERVLRSVEKDLCETKKLKTVKIRDELKKARVLSHRRKWNLLCPSCSARMSKQNCAFDHFNGKDPNTYPGEEFNSKMQKSKHKKINQIISKNKHHRVSIHLGRPVRIKGTKANRKTNSSTGRNASNTKCKTRAAELMQKQKRMKRLKKDVDIGAEEKTAFDSYTVQKSSYNPQQDFRDSMLEMIIEKGIKQPDELEELLLPGRKII